MENTNNTDKIKTDSFVFYRSFIDALHQLPDDTERMKIINAMTSYALDGEEIPLDGYLKGYFNLIKPQLDANIKKRINGKKGGRPKTIGLENQNHRLESQKANGNINANAKENVNENKNKNVNLNEYAGTGKIVHGLLLNARPINGSTMNVPTEESVFVEDWKKNFHLLVKHSKEDIISAVNNFIWVLENTNFYRYNPSFVSFCLSINKFVPSSFNREYFVQFKHEG